MWFIILFFLGYLFLFFRYRLIPLGRMRKCLSDKSAFNSLMVLLGSSAGVGNIIGVGVAMYFAGPGVLFWMSICAIVAATTNFLEVFLSRKFQKNKEEDFGPMNYLIHAFGKPSKIICICYSVLLLIVSLLIGNMCQVGSIKTTLINYPALGVCAIVCIMFIICTRHHKGILSLMGMIMPTICILYLFFCGLCITINMENIPNAFYLIFEGASKPQAFLGIPLFYVFNQGLVFSLFSNEAGNGSAALAFSDNESSASPYRAGLLSSIGPLLDTVFICLATGLTILSSKQFSNLNFLDHNPNEMVYVLEVFKSTLGTFGYTITLFCLILFAFATLISWYYYGCISTKYLKLPLWSYRLIYLIAIILSAYFSISFLMDITNYFNLALLAINMIGIICLIPKNKKIIPD